ncbi:MAG: response regulator [Treponema sp.]|nr:response regulator [Treponema sp.]
MKTIISALKILFTFLVYGIILYFFSSHVSIPASPVCIELFGDKDTIYIRRGFDKHDLANVPKPSGGAWEKFYKGWNNGLSLMIPNAGLDGISAHPSFEEIKNSNNEEFTILSVFDVSQELLASIQRSDSVLGVFIGEINDNYEIYLNGVTVYGDMNLDENGRITARKHTTYLKAPINSRWIKAGENIFAIRLVGNPYSVLMGLRQPPFRIDEFSRLDTGKIDMRYIIAVWAYVFIGIITLIVWTGRNKRFYMLFTAMSVIFGMFLLSKTIWFSTILDNGILAKKLGWLLTFIIPTVISIFIEYASARKKISLPTKIFAGVQLLNGVILCAVDSWHLELPLLRFMPYFTFACLIYVLISVWRFFISDILVKLKAAPRKLRVILNALTDTINGNEFVALNIAGVPLALELIVNRSHFSSIPGWIVFVLMIAWGGFMGISSEIAEAFRSLAAMKEEAEEARRQAEDANRAKSLFFANTSHEIRTPMNAVLGMSELILREPISPTVRGYVANLKSAGTNLLTIINDVLDFSKIESGKMEIASSEYFPASVINDAVNIIHVRIIEKPMELCLRVNANCPALLFGDQVRIRQILINLLSNAVKYTKKGFITLSVDAEIHGNQAVMIFSVKDTGIGIKDEDKPNIFGDFTRVDAAKNRGIEGAGLGLAITRNLCRLMGGDIDFESEYGKGSTFTARIPQKIAIEDVPFAYVDEPETKGVLLFDGNETRASSITYALETLGVPYKRVKDRAGFEAETRVAQPGATPYIFTTCQEESWVMERVDSSCTVVVMAEYGAAVQSPQARLVYFPIWALNIADILNNVAESAGGDAPGAIKFIAPDASVLIVDDVDVNLIVAQGLLSPYQLRISLAKSGQEAVDLARENIYDIIFMDHMMPGMDGIEATALIRSIDRPDVESLPIVALTANAIAGMKDLFLSSGFSDYLAKPIEVDKLNAIVEKWIPASKRISGAARV